MIKEKLRQKQRQRRHAKVRAKIVGTVKCPRLSVFRSNKGLYIQLIDDFQGKTLLSASSSEIKTKGTKLKLAGELGKLVAEKAKEKKINLVVFDRGSYKYHGRVKAVAEGARSGGLKF